jgi:hypothetical protein
LPREPATVVGVNAYRGAAGAGRDGERLAWARPGGGRRAERGRRPQIMRLQLSFKDQRRDRQHSAIAARTHRLSPPRRVDLGLGNVNHSALLGQASPGSDTVAGTRTVDYRVPSARDSGADLSHLGIVITDNDRPDFRGALDKDPRAAGPSELLGVAAVRRTRRLDCATDDHPALARAYNRIAPRSTQG